MLHTSICHRFTSKWKIFFISVKFFYPLVYCRELTGFLRCEFIRIFFMRYWNSHEMIFLSRIRKNIMQNKPIFSPPENMICIFLIRITEWTIILSVAFIPFYFMVLFSCIHHLITWLIYVLVKNLSLLLYFYPLYYNEMLEFQYFLQNLLHQHYVQNIQHHLEKNYIFLKIFHNILVYLF